MNIRSLIYLIILSLSFSAGKVTATTATTETTETTEQAGKGSSTCKKTSADLSTVFGELSTQFTGDTTLITTEIFSGFAQFNDHIYIDEGDSRKPKALGLRITSSLQAGDSNSEDYANASLLLGDGALIGLTASLMGSPRWSHYKGVDNCDAGFTNNYRRNFRTDKTYFGLHPIKDTFTKAYFIHGLTIKAVRPSLSKNDSEVDDKPENDSDSDIKSAATLYLGLGFDGFIHKFGDTNPTKGTIAGLFDISAGVQGTYIKKSALQKIYGNTDIDEDHFFNSFLKATIHITDKFSLDVEHAAPFSDHKFMSDVTSFRLGYSL